MAACGRLGPQPHILHLCLPLSVTSLSCWGPALGVGGGSRGFSSVCKSMKINTTCLASQGSPAHVYSLMEMLKGKERPGGAQGHATGQTTGPGLGPGPRRSCEELCPPLSTRPPPGESAYPTPPQPPYPGQPFSSLGPRLGSSLEPLFPEAEPMGPWDESREGCTGSPPHPDTASWLELPLTPS